MTTSNEKGFTLIELMIVVAIIGILAAVSINAYLGYSARAAAAAGLAEISAGKTNAEEKISNGIAAGGISNPVDIGLKVTTSNCAVTTKINANGEAGIMCEYIGNPAVANQKTMLSRASSGRWSCESNLDNKYIPKTCGFVSTLSLPL